MEVIRDSTGESSFYRGSTALSDHPIQISGRGERI